MSDPFPINTVARNHLRNTAIQIHRSMVIIAAEFAKRDKADEIQTSHIDEARQTLSPKQRINRIRELAKIVGGALMGAFVPGFYASLPINGNAGDALGLIVYAIFGIFGTVLVVWGFR